MTVRIANRAGFSLLELLLVMVLLGILLGVGLGAFTSLDFSGAQARDVVVGALRSARGSALAARAPARVRIDREAGTLVPLRETVVGTWHFESEDLAGAGGLVGSGTGYRLTTDGYLGRALELPAGTRAAASFAVDGDPAFDFRRGFALECAVAPDVARSAHVLSVGSSFGLFVRADGLVRAWFLPETVQGGVPRPGGEVVVESAPGVLAPGRFSRVRAAFDGRRFELAVDDLCVAAVEEEARVWPVEGPLVIGGGSPAFAGRVDALVLAAWTAGDTWELSESASLSPSTPEEIAFDASGRLDRRVHATAPAFEVLLEGGRRLPIVLGEWGTVE